VRERFASSQKVFSHPNVLAVSGGSFASFLSATKASSNAGLGKTQILVEMRLPTQGKKWGVQGLRLALYAISGCGIRVYIYKITSLRVLCRAITA
jgi:hypothetical protein